jgi:pyruvate decarboxylase
LHPKARPAYLTLPTDIVYATISAQPLSVPLERALPKNDEEVEAFVIDHIIKLVRAANHEMVVLVDACAIRHDAKDEVKELLLKTRYPVYAAPMGKTVVSENYERYGGVSKYSISHGCRLHGECMW